MLDFNIVKYSSVDDWSVLQTLYSTTISNFLAINLILLLIYSNSSVILSIFLWDSINFSVILTLFFNITSLFSILFSLSFNLSRYSLKYAIESSNNR